MSDILGGSFMTTKITEGNKYHSAVPSWSGYNYQGKVALYCVLDYMIHRIQADYSRYSIEIEWYEDFSIKEEGSYISIHQVKSYKKKGLSEYKDAIWNLLGKSIEENIHSTYLHTSEDIDLKKDIKKKLCTQAPPQPSKDNKDKKYTPAYYYKMIMDNGNYEKSFQSFHKYKYHTGDHFCKIDKIDCLIKEKIREYYNSQDNDVTNEQINRVFLNLLNCLNEHITVRHVKEQTYGAKTNPISINFTRFYDILEKNHEESSQEYYVRHLKNSFYRISEAFIQQLFQNEIFGADDLIRVDDFLIKLHSLGNENFLDFCKRITPNVTAPKINMEKYRELIPQDGIKKALLVILAKIKQELDENHLFRRKNDSKSEWEFYLPTAIDFNPSDDLLPIDSIIGEISSEILKNEDLDEFLYEVDALISRYISIDSLEESAAKINKVPEVDPVDKPKRYARFTKIKNIRMVNLEQAEKELEK